MKSLLHGIFIALATFMATLSHAAVTEEKPNDSPAWLAQLAILHSTDAEPFQFRASIEVNSYHLIIYVSSIPPNRQCVVVCDGADGLPLMIAVDGDVWLYDLIGGQILHCTGNSYFEAAAAGHRFDYNWGFSAPDKDRGIHVDCASLFQRVIEQKNIFDFAGEYGRVVASKADGYRADLLVTATDPPRPKDFTIESQEGDRLIRSRLDCFHFSAPLPGWHHPLDSKLLASRLPFFHLEDLDHVPPELEPWLKLFKDAKNGSSPFVIRPALHVPALRDVITKEYPHLDFGQIEKHEKLLREVWLRALKEQNFDPAKAFPPLPQGG